MTDEEARAYYEEKKVFLHDMNHVREKYPESFRVSSISSTKKTIKKFGSSDLLDKLSLKEYARLKKITKDE
jgi:YbbR domain-containing protein